MPRLASVAFALTLAAHGIAQQPDLAAIAGPPSPEARVAVARALAREHDLSVPEWIAAIRSFHPTTAHAAGTTRVEIPLWNGATAEVTELYVRVPSGYEPDVAHALILQAHGTGGSGREQPNLWAGVADALPAIVIAPSESDANEGYRFSAREREIALDAIRWAKSTYHIDEDRVFVSGISRGGHETWDLALRFPDRFAAIAPMIGSPRLNPGDGQNNLRYLENVAHLPIRDLQGLQDDPRMIANLRLAFDRLTKLGATDAELVTFAELGHSFRMDAVDWRTFFGDARRDARPQRVVRLAARAGEGRAFWLDVTETDRKTVQETFRLRVTAAEWDALDEAGQRLRMQDECDRLTARAEATFDGPGRFTVQSTGVKAFRILLESDMLPDKGKIEVRWNGRTKRYTRAPDPTILLEEFARRLDRQFLPVAAVDVK